MTNYPRKHETVSAPFHAIYESAGYRIVEVSATEGEGVEEVRELLRGKTTLLSGNSGVGKSSILNVIFPELQLKTGEVSEKLGRGRHTTRHTELYRHALGGFVADTPGFSSVEEGLLTYDFKLHLAKCFRDFTDYTNNCRFTSCSHTCEKGCGLLEAVSEGKIQKSRHNSYVTLYEELKNIEQWNNKGK